MKWEDSPWCSKHALLRNQAMREVDCPHCDREHLRRALEYIANAEGDFDGNVDGNGLRQIAIDALKNSPGV